MCEIGVKRLDLERLMMSIEEKTVKHKGSKEVRSWRDLGGRMDGVSVIEILWKSMAG